MKGGIYNGPGLSNAVKYRVFPKVIVKFNAMLFKISGDFHLFFNER